MDATLNNIYILAGAICACIASTSLFLYTPMGQMTRSSKTSLILFFSYFPVTAVCFLLLAFAQIYAMSMVLIQSLYYALATVAWWLLYAGLSWRRNIPFNLHRSRFFIGNTLFWGVVIMMQTPFFSAYLALDLIYIITVGMVNILILAIMSFYTLKDRKLENVGEQLFAINLFLRILMVIGIVVFFGLTGDITLFYANIAVSSIITTVLTIGAVYCMFLFDRIDKHKSDAETDYLTGILNRRAFMEQVSLQENNQFHQQHSGAIVVCDIDKFKTLNDTYGHDVGDLAIQRLANILTKSLRANDMCARMGGEEFAIFIADSGQSSAHAAIDRIRQNIEKSELIVGEKVIKFTASFGFCMLDREKSLAAHLKEADHAMYEAKHNGRNCVYEYSQSSLDLIKQDAN